MKKLTHRRLTLTDSDDSPLTNKQGSPRYFWILHLVSLVTMTLCTLIVATDTFAKAPEPEKNNLRDKTRLTTHPLSRIRSPTSGPYQPTVAGGPDVAGYIFRDTKETNGPTGTFEPIQTTGTSLSLGNDEMITTAIPLGFSFDFYGQTYTEVYICANGFITFLPDQPCFATPHLPSNVISEPNGLIAGWWQDLVPGDNAIHYETLGTVPERRFIVQFQDVPQAANNNKTATFQIKLFETTDIIEVYYIDTSKEAGQNKNPSARIENEDGSAILYYDANKTPKNEAIKYWQPSLKLSLTVNTVTPGTGQRITYTVRAYNTLTTATNIVSDAVISNTLPQGLTFAGPLTLVPDQQNATLATSELDLPTLASNITISTGDKITLTLPVTISNSPPNNIVNTVSMISSQYGASDDDSVTINPAPTAVRLASFVAARTPEHTVCITWQTAMELDNLGFNLYRALEPGGKRVRLNETLIPVQMPGQLMGSTYQWEDTTSQPNEPYAYWLEDVDIHGVATLHGPVIVRATDNPSAVHINAAAATGNLGVIISLVLAGLYDCAVKRLRRKDRQNE